MSDDQIEKLLEKLTPEEREQMTTLERAIEERDRLGRATIEFFVLMAPFLRKIPPSPDFPLWPEREIVEKKGPSDPLG